MKRSESNPEYDPCQLNQSYCFSFMRQLNWPSLSSRLKTFPRKEGGPQRRCFLMEASGSLNGHSFHRREADRVAWGTFQGFRELRHQMVVERTHSTSVRDHIVGKGYGS